PPSATLFPYTTLFRSGPALQLRLAQNDKHPTASLWLSATLPTTSFAHLILKPHRNWPALASCRDLPVITASALWRTSSLRSQAMQPICYLFATFRETGPVQFKLSTHLLDFVVLISRPSDNTRDLFSQLCNRCLEIVALLCRSGLQLLHLLMCLEELVKQHRIDLFVADRFGLALFIASYQIGIHLCYLLSDQAEG